MYNLCLYGVPNLDTLYPLHDMLYDQLTVLLSVPQKVQRVRVMKLMVGLPLFQTHIGLVPPEGPEKRVEQNARYMDIFICI